MSVSTEPQAQSGQAPVRKPDPLAELQTLIATIRQSGQRYLAASLDSAKARVRQALLRIALAIAAAMLLLLVAAVGAVLLLVGAAQAVAAGLGWPVWAGLLLVGGGAILLTVIVVRAGLGFAEKKSLEHVRERIAERARNDGNAS